VLIVLECWAGRLPLAAEYAARCWEIDDGGALASTYAALVDAYLV
jgi:hypothetical protein